MGDGEWMPTNAEVDELEAQLSNVLARLPESRQRNFSELLAKWRRQYVGIERGGRRFVYGNYFTILKEDDHDWRNKPINVCDGGSSAFGVEYDVAAKRVTRIDFNGDAGTRYEGNRYGGLARNESN